MFMSHDDMKVGWGAHMGNDLPGLVLQECALSDA